VAKRLKEVGKRPWLVNDTPPRANKKGVNSAKAPKTGVCRNKKKPNSNNLGGRAWPAPNADTAQLPKKKPSKKSFVQAKIKRWVTANKRENQRQQTGTIESEHRGDQGENFVSTKRRTKNEKIKKENRKKRSLHSRKIKKAGKGQEFKGHTTQHIKRKQKAKNKQGRESGGHLETRSRKKLEKNHCKAPKGKTRDGANETTPRARNKAGLRGWDGVP